MKYLCMTKAILTPRIALKLKWGKYFNDTGKPGGCIPIDQRVEHEVCDVKDHISAQRYCHSQSKGQTILTNIDRVLGVTPQSKGHSTVSSADDVEIMGNCPSEMCLVRFQDDVTLHFLTTLKTSWSVLTWEN